MPGTLRITIIEPNTWKPGSSWTFRLMPTPTDGTRIDVSVLRLGALHRAGFSGSRRPPMAVPGRGRRAGHFVKPDSAPDLSI
jgi:hypothetical protein